MLCIIYNGLIVYIITHKKDALLRNSASLIIKFKMYEK